VQVIGTYIGSEPEDPKLTATSITTVEQPTNPYDH